jgi:phenylalanyl-tRNA synthetase beta subunit
MAIGLVLQSDVRTLQDEEVQTMMTAVITALEKQLSAVLRTTTIH